MKRDYETGALEAVANGEARRIDLADGYVVVQKWGSELFLLFIKWTPHKLNFPAMLDALKLLAKFEHCDTIAGIGRSGWGRILKPYGFTESSDGTLELVIKES